jgi:serine/threonine protein phosphatase PrpC
MSLDWAEFSHPGGHHENQDVVAVREADSGLLAVVCDGLGGMGNGRRAAEFCAGVIADALEEPATTPGEAITSAHEALLELQRQEPGLRNARSTAVVARISEAGALEWASCGDSRVYTFAGGELGWSPDDSAGYAAFQRGECDHEDIRFYDGRSHLTACLGDDRPLTPHEGTAELNGDDAFLLASDGFWQYVRDVETQLDLAKAADAADWLNLMLLRLAQRSHLDGDNISAIACIVKGN